MPIALLALALLALSPCPTHAADDACPADLALSRTYVGVLQQQRNELELALLQARISERAATQKLEEAKKPAPKPDDVKK